MGRRGDHDRSAFTRPLPSRKLRRILADATSPSALTPQTLAAIIADAAPDPSAVDVDATIDALVKDYLIVRVVDGVFLNRCRDVNPGAAAPLIVPGAIASLYTVLGDHGILNNYTHDIYCVVPGPPDQPVTRLRSAIGLEYVFHAIPKARLLRPAREDQLQPVDYPRATCEAALCHWIYLANSRYSSLTPLPRDLDLEDIDVAKLDRVAAAMGLKGAVDRWKKAADWHYEQGVTPGLGF